MKVKCDHRSKFSNLSNWKEEAWKKTLLWKKTYFELQLKADKPHSSLKQTGTFLGWRVFPPKQHICSAIDNARCAIFHNFHYLLKQLYLMILYQMKGYLVKINTVELCS